MTKCNAQNNVPDRVLTWDAALSKKLDSRNLLQRCPSRREDGTTYPMGLARAEDPITERLLLSYGW